MSTDQPSYEEHMDDLFPPIVPDEVGDVQYSKGIFWCSADAVIVDRGAEEAFEIPHGEASPF